MSLRSTISRFRLLDEKTEKSLTPDEFAAAWDEWERRNFGKATPEKAKSAGKAIREKIAKGRIRGGTTKKGKEVRAAVEKFREKKAAKGEPPETKAREIGQKVRAARTKTAAERLGPDTVFARIKGMVQKHAEKHAEKAAKKAVAQSEREQRIKDIIDRAKSIGRDIDPDKIANVPDSRLDRIEKVFDKHGVGVEEPEGEAPPAETPPKEAPETPPEAEEVPEKPKAGDTEKKWAMWAAKKGGEQGACAKHGGQTVYGRCIVKDKGEIDPKTGKPVGKQRKVGGAAEKLRLRKFAHAIGKGSPAEKALLARPKRGAGMYDDIATTLAHIHALSEGRAIAAYLKKHTKKPGLVRRALKALKHDWQKTGKLAGTKKYKALTSKQKGEVEKMWAPYEYAQAAPAKANLRDKMRLCKGTGGIWSGRGHCIKVREGGEVEIPELEPAPAPEKPKDDEIGQCVIDCMKKCQRRPLAMLGRK